MNATPAGSVVLVGKRLPRNARRRAFPGRLFDEWVPHELAVIA